MAVAESPAGIPGMQLREMEATPDSAIEHAHAFMLTNREGSPTGSSVLARSGRNGLNVDHRRAHVAVAQHFLDRLDIVVRQHEMACKGVAESVGRDFFVRSQAIHRLPEVNSEVVRMKVISPQLVSTRHLCQSLCREKELPLGAYDAREGNRELQRPALRGMEAKPCGRKQSRDYRDASKRPTFAVGAQAVSIPLHRLPDH